LNEAPRPQGRRGPYVGRLDSVAAVRREVVRLYKRAVSGELPAADASRLGSLLALAAQLIRDHELERRLERVEGELAALEGKSLRGARWAA
jgi:hypothetical protein